MLYKTLFFALIIAFIIGLASIFTPATHAGAGTSLGENIMQTKPTDGLQETAIFAGGCFWCLESEFRALDGVLYTMSGYTGGDTENPTYKDITTGKTGHAEAVEVTYDPTLITYSDLTEFFLTKGHDPTQLNRQGVDVGTQYRSGIFYLNDAQKKIAQGMIKDVDARGIYKKKIVTEVTSASAFYVAEEYHQQYYEKYEEKNGVPHLRVLLKKGKKF